MKELADVNTYFFADESKFSVNNGDPENAIYYFVVGCVLEKLSDVRKAFEQTLDSFGIDVFHSTDLFKEKSPKEKLIHSLTNLIIEQKLECYCFKYHKDSIYESVKTVFAHHNVRPEINFNNQEFQALFFLVQVFDSYLSSNSKSIQEKAVIFFDRNVYGRKDTEAYNFENSQPIKRMVFFQKNKIDLLALPDFFGFMFRKSKLFHNQRDLNLNPTETPLISYCHNALTAITKAGLFHFLSLDNWLKEKA